MDCEDDVDSVLIVDAVNVYRFSSSGSVLSQLRPSSFDDWKQLRAVNPQSLLLSVIGHPLGKEVARAEGGVGAPLRVGDCDLESIAPGVFRFRADDLSVYALDLLEPLVIGYPGHLAVVIGESSIAMRPPGVVDLSSSISSVWSGTADIQPMLGFLGSGEIRGASTVALDGCLSAVWKGERVVVGVSATTTIASMLAAAIFDCAAAIFQRGGSADYVIAGWTRETAAIAADLAVLSGRPVRLVDPLIALRHHRILSDLRWPREGEDTVIQPVGPQRLLRRGFADWERLGSRLGKLWSR